MSQSDLSASFSCCEEIWMNEPTIPIDLHTSCAIGAENRVQELLADGLEICDLDKLNKGGWTPLMYSSYVGHERIVNLLLDNNVDVNAREVKCGATPLMLSASCGIDSVVSLLLDNRARINVQDDRGWTALFYATHLGHRSVVKMLIDKGADLELRESRRGFTPLLAAAFEGYAEIFSLLVESGANLSTRTNFGEDVGFLANSRHQSVILSLINQQSFINVSSPQLRSEAGLLLDEMSDGNRTPVIGIHDGPEAFERLRVSKSDLRLGLPSSEEHATSKPYPISRSPAQTPEFTGGSFEEHFFIRSGSTVKSATLHTKLMAVNQHDSQPDGVTQGFIPANQSDPNLPNIVKFLTDLKLERFIALFEEKGIDCEKLLSLNENDLQEIGVKPFGPRRKIFSSLDKWRKDCIRPSSLPNQFAHSPRQEATTLQQALAQNQLLSTQLSQERQLHSFREEVLKEEKNRIKQMQELVSEVEVMLKDLLVNVNALKSVKSELQNSSYLGEDFKGLTLNLDDPVANLEKIVVASFEKVDQILTSPSVGSRSQSSNDISF